MSEEPNREVAILNTALALSEPERSTYLAQACAGDTAFRQRIEELLAANEQAENFLESSPARLDFTRPTAVPLPLTEKPGDKIGRYKLLQKIGEGGCGVVYMAEQEEPVRRRVALKVIKLGMDTKSVIARFEAERQALALMDHLNIARVLDAGATEMGRPYFVMELVRGIKITEFCDANKLSTENRLKLFIQVCQAIQHAHQKGIIHRDIKPSNILVTVNDGVPVPKVIDFGIAKATQGRLTDKTLFTAFEQFIGTPAYMSPEQAVMTSLDIDTRSDIYSLGVLLYELLTGKTPFDAKELLQSGLDAMRRTILEVEPPKPSTRLTQELVSQSQIENRESEIKATIHLVRGDLDWIVMKSLEKDRARRYETANGLAADIQRHLNNEPVNASPPGGLYRLHKAVRRNKGAVAAAAAITGALVFGVIASTQEAIRATRAEREQIQLRLKAETNEKKSEQVAQFLKATLNGAGPSVARGRDATVLREILDKAAGRVELELKEQPEVQSDLWFILGGTYADIGDLPRAMTNFQHAADCYRLAFRGDHIKLAQSLGYLGRCQSFQNDIPTGEANARLGLEMARRCGDPETVALCLANMAKSFNFYGMGDPQGIPYLREAVALRRKLNNNPVALADCMEFLACCMDDDDAEGMSMLRQALALHRQALGEDHPRVTADLLVIGEKLIHRKELKEAEIVLRESVELYRRILDPNDPYQFVATRFLSEALIRQGKGNEAESMARQFVDEFPSNASYHAWLGILEAYKGNWEPAAEQLSRAFELKPDVSDYRCALIPVLVLAGRDEEYCRLRHEYLQRVSSGVRDDRDLVEASFHVLLLPGDEADLKQASQYADAVADSIATTDEDSQKLIKALVEYRRGHFESAQDWINRVVSRADGWLPRQVEARYIQALVCVRLGQMEPARAALAKGDDLVKQYDPDDLLWQKGLMNIARVLGREARMAIESQSAPAPGE